jgi:hypothetical protein
MKWTAAVIAAVIAAAAAGPALGQEANLADWQRRAAITLESEPVKGVAEFAITDEVFDAARADLTDLRIIDDTGAQTGYVLRVAERKVVATPLSGTLFNQTYLPGQQSSATVDFGSKVMKNRVEVSTDGASFWRKATVESSDDGVMWHMVVEGAMLIRKQGDAASAAYEKRTITFPPNDERYLKVTVFNGPDDPDKVEIRGVSASRNVEEPAETADVKVLSSKVTQDTEHRETDIVLDLGWRNLPISELRLAFGEANFFRSFALYGRDSERETIKTMREDLPPAQQVVDTPWEAMTGGTLYKFSGGKNPEESLSIRPQGKGFRYLKVTIYNANDPPLQFTEAEAKRYVQYAAFQPRAGRRYMLYFGNEQAPEATYDLAQYAGRLRGEGVTKAALETAEANPAKAPEKQAPWSERHRGLIWVALLAVLVVLGGLVMRQMKAAEKAAQKPEAGEGPGGTS